MVSVTQDVRTDVGLKLRELPAMRSVVTINWSGYTPIGSAEASALQLTVVPLFSKGDACLMARIRGTWRAAFNSVSQLPTISARITTGVTTFVMWGSVCADWSRRGSRRYASASIVAGWFAAAMEAALPHCRKFTHVRFVPIPAR